MADDEATEVEQTPEAEEKKPRIYKGVVVKADALDLSGGPVVVQTMPEVRKAHKLPLFMLVDRIDPNLGIRYRDPRDGMRQKNALVAKPDAVRALELNVLQGRMGQELREELARWKAAQPINANWPGGHLGADPEMFVVDKKGDIIPAWEFLGSKKAPNDVKGGPGYMWRQLYWDGFQAEFTVYNTSCLGYVSDSIAYGLIALYNAAKKHNKNAVLSIDSVLPVPDDVLASAKDEHVEFGCMPSLNAYGLEGNKLPGREVPMRFAGGHIHMGIAGNRPYTGNYKEAVVRGVKSLDAILGVACVSLFEGYDNPARRAFYGLPGEYRLPPHGLEYRSLSNAWLVHPVIMNVVMDLSRRAFGYGWQASTGWESPEEETIACMRDNDVGLARKILKRNQAAFKSISGYGVYADTQDTLYKLFLTGMAEHLKTPRDVAANWRLANGAEGWVPHCEGHEMNWTRAKGSLSQGKAI